MAGSAGTPLWLILTLQLLTALGTLTGTHFLTRSRERTKKQDEIVKEWRDKQETLLAEAIDLAKDHYSNPSSLAGTQISASRIITRLRKFRNRFQDVAVVVPADAAEANRLYVQLNLLITGLDDFQDVNRQVRSIDDVIFAQIEDCEEALRRNLNKPRVARVS